MGSGIHRFLHDRLLARDGLNGVADHLDRLIENEWKSTEQIKAMQLEKLQGLLRHAYDHTRFYKERFDACGFDPEKFSDLSDLERIPILTKYDIQKRADDLQADNIPESALHSSRTGGTTGHFLSFKRDNACLPVKEAALMRFETWCGWDYGEWIALVWPAFIDLKSKKTWKSELRNRLGPRLMIMSMVGEQDEQTRIFAAEMLAKSPALIRAFPTALAPFAQRVRDEGLPMPRIKGVISTGEMLSPTQRALFQDVFGAPVFDSYRSREGGPVAQQCEQLGGLHISADLLCLEIDKQQIVETDAEGREYGPILITDLHNYGMPLIRYEVGDVGALDNKPCACGRGLPILHAVGGRLADVLYTVDKRPLASANLIPNFFWNCSIENQFQLIQPDFNRLLLRLTRPELDAETVEKLQVQAGRVFGEGVTLDLEYVDSIPLKSSGKYHLMVCEIPSDSLPD
jgi:phenylacetate-coenzyme A ligase PaaK-like adenylate-forming protein